MAALFASIPVPQTNLDSLQETCMRLKEAVEQIVGLHGGMSMAGLYVQDTMPAADKDGRFWLCTLGTNMSLNVAVSGKWLKVGTLT